MDFLVSLIRNRTAKVDLGTSFNKEYAILGNQNMSVNITLPMFIR